MSKNTKGHIPIQPNPWPPAKPKSRAKKRLIVSLIALAMAVTLTAGANAAPFAFVDSVRAFIGMEPAQNSVAPALALAEPLAANTANTVVEPMLMITAGGSFTAFGSPLVEDFNTLSSTAGPSISWTDNSTISGAYATDSQYTVGTGSSNAGGLYSFGSASAADRALGSIAASSISHIYAFKLTNNTSGSIVSLSLSYTGEQWRSGSNSSQSLGFEYQVANSGVITDANMPSTGWIAVSALNFASPQNSVATGQLDGNDAANRTMLSNTFTLNTPATVGQEIWIRWVDLDDTESDHALAIDDVSVTANALNTAPTISDITDSSTNEDFPTGAIAFTIGDGQTAANDLLVSATSSNLTLVPNANITFGGGGANRTLNITPAPNLSGMTTITVTVTDGGSLTASDTFVLTVVAVNDEPTLDNLSNLMIAEDAASQTVNLSGISAGGGETQVLTVSASSSNTSLIPTPTVNYTSANALGSISFAPVANQSGGPVTITVTVMDDGGTTNPGDDDTISKTFTVTVTSVNDEPAGANNTVTINEDATYTFAASAFGFSDVNDSPANMLFAVKITTIPGAGTLLLNGNPVTALDSISLANIPNLTFTPATNANGTGYASFTFQVQDNGGVLNGGVDLDQSANSFTFNVTAVNDEPTLNALTNRSIFQNQPPQMVSLSGISAGGGESQVLTLSATSNNQTLIPDANLTFPGYVSPSNTGSLSFMSVNGQSGTAIITVTVMDDGGTSNGGDNSVSQTFTVTVAPCPVISTANISSLTGPASPAEGSVPVTIPISTTALSPLTSPAVISADITFTFNTSVLQFVSATVPVTGAGAGSLITANNSPNGTVTISITKATGFDGSGSLVDLNFNVIGAINSTTNLTVTAVSLNEGNICSTIAAPAGVLTVISGTITGQVFYSNVVNGLPGPTPYVPVPGVTLTAVGGTTVTSAATTVAGNGTYSLSGFGPGPYTITPSKANQSQNGNGISSLDASRIAQHVVGINPLLVNNQLTAADTSENGGITSFDAALIAQYLVGIPNALNKTSQWRFSPASTSPNVTLNGVQDYGAILLGDVNGSWSPTGTQRPQIVDEVNAIRSSVPTAEARAGSIATVPFRIDNLKGEGVLAYQFDIEYDPAVVAPAAVAADITGTLSESLLVFSNAPTPGTLKVVVFGAVPVTGDGVYVNLRFATIGAAGSSTPLTIERFSVNDGNSEAVNIGGRLTITAAQDGLIRGRVTTPGGQGVRNAIVVLTNASGEQVTATTSSFGRFEFPGLAIGGSYTVTVQSKRYRFAPQIINVTQNLNDLEMIAQE